MLMKPPFMLQPFGPFGSCVCVCFSLYTKLEAGGAVLIYPQGGGLPYETDGNHHQSLFIHEIVSFYMVFLGIVFKTRLKY